jgi:hypothetical protein
MTGGPVIFGGWTIFSIMFENGVLIGYLILRLISRWTNWLYQVLGTIGARTLPTTFCGTVLKTGSPAASHHPRLFQCSEIKAEVPSTNRTRTSTKLDPHFEEQTRTETMSRYPLRYNVQEYCRKYPDDPGYQTINNGDVVRPRRDLKWAGQNEQHEWVRDKHLSIPGLPTYGTCAVCWSSGPSYDTCAECKKGLYKLLSIGEAILDSQTFSTKMNKTHQTARAGGTHTKFRHDMRVFNPHDIAVQMHHIFEKKNAHLKNARENEENHYSMRMWHTLQAFFKDYNGLFNGHGAMSLHQPIEEMFQSEIEQILLPSAQNDSTERSDLDNFERKPTRYIIKDYCKKYPNNPGDQNIHDDDVVRPLNKKWSDSTESERCRPQLKRKSCVGLRTYGNCGSCWASGPAYKSCITCVCDEYRCVTSFGYVLDSQTLAQKLGTNHEIAIANWKQNWTRIVRTRLILTVFAWCL